MRSLHLSLFKTLLAWGGALAVASSAHAALVWGMMYYTPGNETPPILLNSFEIVDLAASVASRAVDNKPVIEPEPKKVIEPEPEPEPEVIAEPEPQPELTAPQPEPEPVRVVQKKPQPKLAALAKVKPKRKPKPKPVQVAKLEVKPEPVAKPEKPRPPTAKPVFQGTQEVVAATAYVPPSQHATYLNNPKPTYPTKARKRGMEGRVVLRVTVRGDGKVKSIKFEKKSGFSVLDRAARAAVLRWRFAPAKRGGVPVEGIVLVPFDFRLTSG